MAPIKLLFAAALLSVCFNSCSQTTAPASSQAGIFIATTPCDDVSKKLLHIPLDTKYAMMKWRLELNQDPATLNPTTYKLVVKYGMDKQGSRDFAEGAQTIELKGKWTLEKKFTGNAAVIVYILSDESASASLSFLQVGSNLLHLLDEDHHPVVGTGAWSYTLNRIDPVHSAPSKLAVQTTSSPLSTDSVIVGVFDGRTPCNNDLLALNGISSNGCQIIKCRLTLYQDIKTHTPTTFQLYTVYVGKGDNRYSTAGKWTVTKGTQDDHNAIVYQLQPDSGKSQSLSFMKAGDNILFMLDENRNLLVGNDYVSFTLNKGNR
jgi:hypothetical protein